MNSELAKRLRVDAILLSRCYYPQMPAAEIHEHASFPSLQRLLYKIEYPFGIELKKTPLKIYIREGEKGKE
jgi:hypothetical protein